VTVGDQLARHVAALCKAGTEHNIVQTALKDLQQVLAGLTWLALCFCSSWRTASPKYRTYGLPSASLEAATGIRSPWTDRDRADRVGRGASQMGIWVIRTLNPSRRVSFFRGGTACNLRPYNAPWFSPIF